MEILHWLNFLLLSKELLNNGIIQLILLMGISLFKANFHILNLLKIKLKKV
jgi:hypothetical protein